jgi:hypothetical protein
LSIDISDLRPTIVPKSDQLNAEQLLAGPMTITVTEVRVGSGDDQPISVHYVNDGGRPYKPCKTMRKVLILAWGHDARNWAGRSMTLYNDPNVKFGGMEVGGLRISHLSDIERDIKVSLTATKGKKAPHVIGLLPPQANAAQQIANAATLDELKTAFGAAYKATRDQAQRAKLKTAYDVRLSELTPPAVSRLPQYLAQLETLTSADAAALLLDEARDELNADEMAALSAAYEKAWPRA